MMSVMMGVMVCGLQILVPSVPAEVSEDAPKKTYGTFDQWDKLEYQELGTTEISVNPLTRIVDVKLAEAVCGQKRKIDLSFTSFADGEISDIKADCGCLQLYAQAGSIKAEEKCVLKCGIALPVNNGDFTKRILVKLSNGLSFIVLLSGKTSPEFILEPSEIDISKLVDNAPVELKVYSKFVPFEFKGLSSNFLIQEDQKVEKSQVLLQCRIRDDSSKRKFADVRIQAKDRIVTLPVSIREGKELAVLPRSIPRNLRSKEFRILVVGDVQELKDDDWYLANKEGVVLSRLKVTGRNNKVLRLFMVDQEFEIPSHLEEVCLCCTDIRLSVLSVN